MDNTLLNIWGPVAVSFALTAMLTFVVYKREKRQARNHELYKESLNKISMLLNNQITRENYDKICKINDSMSKKYLTRKIMRSLRDVIKDYASLLDKHSYYQEKACAFLSAFYIELRQQKRISDRDLSHIEDKSKTQERLNKITILFEQHPFLYIDNDITLIEKAVLICTESNSLTDFDLDGKFIYDCGNRFVRNLSNKDMDMEAYFESQIIDIQFVQSLRIIRERFNAFSILCEKYN